MAKKKPDAPKDDVQDKVAVHLAAGHSRADLEACLADFKAQGRADKVAYYEAVLAAYPEG